MMARTVLHLPRCEAVRGHLRNAEVTMGHGVLHAREKASIERESRLLNVDDSNGTMHPLMPSHLNNLQEPS